jgi:hypothetical protein
MRDRLENRDSEHLNSPENSPSGKSPRQSVARSHAEFIDLEEKIRGRVCMTKNWRRRMLVWPSTWRRSRSTLRKR